MSKTEDDLESMTEDELLALPEEALPVDPSRLAAMRSDKIHERDFDELLMELAGDSSRHLMISPEKDPKEKQRREEQHRRELQLAWEQQMRDIRDRQDRLLLQIDERQVEIEKRRQEIEDNALRLRDGRRIYVDGDRYRDGEGRVLTGADEAEAARQHEYRANASTWEQKQENDRQDEEARRLKDKILKDREDGIGPEEAARRLDADEAALHAVIEQRATQDTAYDSADYMAEYGSDQISSRPEFTRVAATLPETARQPSEAETESASTDNKKAFRADGPGTFKPV